MDKLTMFYSLREETIIETWSHKYNLNQTLFDDLARCLQSWFASKHCRAWSSKIGWNDWNLRILTLLWTKQNQMKFYTQIDKIKKMFVELSWVQLIVNTLLISGACLTILEAANFYNMIMTATCQCMCHIERTFLYFNYTLF